MGITIIYVPLIYMRDRGTYPPTSPCLWYFNWQKEIWMTFIELGFAGLGGDYKVIWKAGPRTSNLVDPIKYRKARYIKYSTKKLSKELKKVDLAIIDYPSTPLREALEMEIPTLCLVPIWDDKYIRKEYKHLVKVTMNPNVVIHEWIKEMIHGR